MSPRLRKSAHAARIPRESGAGFEAAPAIGMLLYVYCTSVWSILSATVFSGALEPGTCVPTYVLTAVAAASGGSDEGLFGGGAGTLWFRCL